MRKIIKKIKILHGMADIAGQGSYSACGLREEGADAIIAVWTRNPFGYPVDVDLRINKKNIGNPYYFVIYSFRMLHFAIKAAIKYDIFHFHFGHTLLPFGLDLFGLHLMGKKIIMEYHGSEIRYCYNQEMPKYYPYKELVKFSKRAISENNRILKYADAVITHDEELRKHIPYSNLYITPLRINIDRLRPIYPDQQNKRVVIVHAPSNYVSKGSKYVIASVEELKKKYDIEFVLVENKTQEEAIEIYRKADIIVDQLYAATYGVFAIEAMALGKPVVAYIAKSIKQTFPSELPIVSATVESLTEKLEMLVKDGWLRNKLGKEGRKYVEDYHDYRKIAQVQLDIYEDRILPMSTLDSFKYTKQKITEK